MAPRPGRYDCWLRGIRRPFHMGSRPRAADPANRSFIGFPFETARISRRSLDQLSRSPPTGIRNSSPGR